MHRRSPWGGGADIWMSSPGTNRSPLSPLRSLPDLSWAEERLPVLAVLRLVLWVKSPFVGWSVTCSAECWSAVTSAELESPKIALNRRSLTVAAWFMPPA